MALVTVAGGQPIRSTHVSQFTRWVTGATKDQSFTPITTHATEYTATLTNEETSAGNVLKLVSGASTIALFNKTGATLSVPLFATGVLAGLFSATGQILYGSGGTGATTLNIGSTFQALIVNSGAAAPTYAASLQSLLASAGSLIGASAANTPVHIPKGSAFQSLVMNPGATGQTWATGVLASAVTAGDIFYAPAPNAISRLAAGTARQGLIMSAGATAPSWAASLQSLLTTAGQFIYATSANTPVALNPPGTAGQFLTISATGVPSWASGSVVRNVATSAFGATAAPTTTSTSYTDLNDMSCTLTTSGGDLLAWFNGTFQHATTTAGIKVAFSLDGATEVNGATYVWATSNQQVPFAMTHRFVAPSATSHTLKVRWFTSTGTATGVSTDRALVVMET